MKFRLLAPHFINDRYMERGEVVDNIQPTPDMEGLDDEGKEAVKKEKIRVFGRYPGVPHGWPSTEPLLDDPPIERPAPGENQPVFHFVGSKEYIS